MMSNKKRKGGGKGQDSEVPSEQGQASKKQEQASNGGTILDIQFSKKNLETLEELEARMVSLSDNTEKIGKGLEDDFKGLLSSIMATYGLIGIVPLAILFQCDEGMQYACFIMCVYWLVVTTPILTTFMKMKRMEGIVNGNIQQVHEFLAEVRSLEEEARKTDNVATRQAHQRMEIPPNLFGRLNNLQIIFRPFDPLICFIFRPIDPLICCWIIFTVLVVLAFLLGVSIPLFHHLICVAKPLSSSVVSRSFDPLICCWIIFNVLLVLAFLLGVSIPLFHHLGKTIVIFCCFTYFVICRLISLSSGVPAIPKFELQVG